MRNVEMESRERWASGLSCSTDRPWEAASGCRINPSIRQEKHLHKACYYAQQSELFVGLRQHRLRHTVGWNESHKRIRNLCLNQGRLGCALQLKLWAIWMPTISRLNGSEVHVARSSPALCSRSRFVLYLVSNTRVITDILHYPFTIDVGGYSYSCRAHIPEKPIIWHVCVFCWVFTHISAGLSCFPYPDSLTAQLVQMFDARHVDAM